MREVGSPRQHDLGALHFGTREDLWLAVGTASLGPSGKKDPGWCRGTLPRGFSTQTVSLVLSWGTGTVLLFLGFFRSEPGPVCSVLAAHLA